MKPQIPERIVRLTAGTPTIDVPARTIQCVIATRLLARDGGILMPEGIVTKYYEQNPVVQAMHGAGVDSHSPVIGRCLLMKKSAIGIEARTQFAETDLGREYAYLYGCNPDKEVYMRAWSFGWRTIRQEWWTVDQARSYLGADWDPVAAANLSEVWVAAESEMHEYSAVPIGADRAALSRAYSDGIRVAGSLVSDLDLATASAQIAALKLSQETERARLDQLSQDVLALRRDGAAAAARGDTAEVLNGLRELRDMLRK